MFIIWLGWIWVPSHRPKYHAPLRAGTFLLPLTASCPRAGEMLVRQ